MLSLQKRGPIRKHSYLWRQMFDQMVTVPSFFHLVMKVLASVMLEHVCVQQNFKVTVHL